MCGGACSAWHLRCLALAAYGACRLRGLDPVVPGPGGACRLQRLEPLALSDWGVWRRWCLAPLPVWVGIEASRGPNEPKSVFLGCSHGNIVVIHDFWARWTPTCCNMPCTAFIPTTVSLIEPLEASRGPNETKSVSSRCPWCDLIAMCPSWVRWTLPTAPICHTQFSFLPLSVWFGLLRP